MGGVLIGGTVLAVALALPRPLPARADLGGTILTEKLLKTSQDLQRSLSATPTSDSRRTTEAYIGHLTTIEQLCATMQQYSRTSTQQAPTSDTTVYLKKSVKLCDDLSDVATTSRKLYQASQPVLAIDTQVKRFQTLPWVRSGIRSNHLALVATALDQTKPLVSTTDFPTESYSLLQQLQQQMHRSRNLDYLPAVAQYQRSLLTERKRYWTSYADISGLIQALSIQADRYCKNLPTNDAKNIAVCRTHA